MGGVIEQYIGKAGKKLFFLFCWLFTLLVIAAFADMVAGTFNGFSADGAKLQPNAAAASISMLYIVVAIAFGLFLKKTKIGGWKQALMGIILIIAMLLVVSPSHYISVRMYGSMLYSSIYSLPVLHQCGY